MEQSGKISKKLVCNGVSKSFYSPKGDEFKVLDNITFDVNENEFLVLFGPGQCGKTTLLYMLAGIETPTAGFIAHNGKAVTRPDASRAVVYQTMALFPWLTVKGNVEFGPKTRGVPPSKRDPKTQKFIDMVGLTGVREFLPGAAVRRYETAGGDCQSLLQRPGYSVDGRTFRSSGCSDALYDAGITGQNLGK